MMGFRISGVPQLAGSNHLGLEMMAMMLLNPCFRSVLVLVLRTWVGVLGLGSRWYELKCYCTISPAGACVSRAFD